MNEDHRFASEAELVAAFCACIDPAKWARNPDAAPKWTHYHETCGWDLLLAHPDDYQVGIEAKLSLNAKVLEQALPGHWSADTGPDYRAVLVPAYALQRHLTVLAAHVGITIISMRGGDHAQFSPWLPDEASNYSSMGWWNWGPTKRCVLPDYVPDVTGGKSAPVRLTAWKVKAIRLLILLERKGSVTRADMKTLGLDPTRWTAAGYGWLDPGPAGWVRGESTPDFKAQHPRNWAEIEAQFDTWAKDTTQALL